MALLLFGSIPGTDGQVPLELDPNATIKDLKHQVSNTTNICVGAIDYIEVIGFEDAHDSQLLSDLGFCQEMHVGINIREYNYFFICSETGSNGKSNGIYRFIPLKDGTYFDTHPWHMRPTPVHVLEKRAKLLTRDVITAPDAMKLDYLEFRKIHLDDYASIFRHIMSSRI